MIFFVRITIATLALSAVTAFAEDPLVPPFGHPGQDNRAADGFVCSAAFIEDAAPPGDLVTGIRDGGNDEVTDGGSDRSGAYYSEGEGAPDDREDGF